MSVSVEQLPFELPPVLDACCGPRMFWFDPNDPRALFIDRRRETHIRDARDGRAPIIINPDLLADFTRLPFEDDSFHLVVFDPPHMYRNRSGKGGYFPKIYGVLADNWPDIMRTGFAECFRVLRPNGTLVFKWADSSVPVSHVLMTTPHKPLFGSRRGRHTHWYVFMKSPTNNSGARHGE